MQNKNSACLVLAYNEENFIENTILNIAPLFEEIIIVNDSSTDNTERILSNLTIDNLKVINNSKNYGAGKSMMIGIDEFLKSELDYLIKIDGDNQFKPEDIKRLINHSSDNFDFIKCDRFWEKGIEGKIPTIRYIGNALANFLIKISTGNWKINDPLNGLFLFSRKSLKNFTLPKLFYKYGYPFYINIYMNKKILEENVKNGQMNNTIKYSNEKSRLKPSVMFFKLIYFAIKSFFTKIWKKLQFSTLQISALLDIFFVIFLSFTLYSGFKLLLINLDYLRGSRASWLFLTILMFFISSTCFYLSQAYEKKVYEDKYHIL